MAVPNTNTFTLQDVIAAIAGTQDDLVECFAEATASAFDPTYGSISDNDMLAFRNYSEAANTLTISPTFRSQSSAAFTFTITVTSNTTWSVSDNAAFTTFSPSSGSGNGSISVSGTSNGTASTRFSTITVQTTSGSPSISRSCVIEQAGTGGGGA